MPELTLQLIVFLVGLAVLTAGAAIWDIGVRRIPNVLTLPVFALGLVYQAWFNGFAGLGDAALGFALGFGTLFVLWMIGGGGGGDVKLMGALSVWLGFKLTLYVMIVSTFLVILITGGVILASLVTGGRKRGLASLTSPGRVATSEAPPAVIAPEQKVQRRVTAFAVPVFLATWIVVIWKLPTFPGWI